MPPRTRKPATLDEVLGTVEDLAERLETVAPRPPGGGAYKRRSWLKASIEEGQIRLTVECSTEINDFIANRWRLLTEAEGLEKMEDRSYLLDCFDPIEEFSVQDNHLHLVIEADEAAARGRGMKSFSVRANRLFNAALERGRGPVWDGRYHFTELKTPRQVRNALVYCINNYKKHYAIHDGRMTIDACSSARWFTGWSEPRSASDADGPRPTEEAKSFLLKTGWRKHGLIHPSETPRATG